MHHIEWGRGYHGVAYSEVAQGKKKNNGQLEQNQTSQTPSE